MARSGSPPLSEMVVLPPLPEWCTVNVADCDPVARGLNDTSRLMLPPTGIATGNGKGAVYLNELAPVIARDETIIL